MLRNFTRLAGDLYYVGASDIAAFLITGPEGHVVRDGGYPSTAHRFRRRRRRHRPAVEGPHPDRDRRLPGHARGCASWSFPVRDGDRVLNVVSACSLVVLQGMRYPEQSADFERSFRVLRSLPADIWVTCHARQWGRYRKFVASSTAKNPADPFIDPEGYRAYIDRAEAEFRQGVGH